LQASSFLPERMGINETPSGPISNPFSSSLILLLHQEQTQSSALHPSHPKTTYHCYPPAQLGKLLYSSSVSFGLIIHCAIFPPTKSLSYSPTLPIFLQPPRFLALSHHEGFSIFCRRVSFCSCADSSQHGQPTPSCRRW
jgi:hypothetical protein